MMLGSQIYFFQILKNHTFEEKNAMQICTSMQLVKNYETVGNVQICTPMRQVANYDAACRVQICTTMQLQ